MSDFQTLKETVPLIKFRLKNFKQVNTNLWNFSCPICGDSKRHKTRARGYIYKNTHDKDLWYKCHNCDYHKPYKFFLKDFDESLYQKTFLTQYVNSNKTKKDLDLKVDLEKIDLKEVIEEEFDENLLDSLMTCVLRLDKNHPALSYLLNRKIPLQRLKDIYYMEDIRDIGQLSEKYTEKLTKKEPRICIPYRNRKGQIIGVSLRSLDKNHPIKYLHIKFNENYPLIYNIESIEMTERVYVTEGQFDSMFFKNGIAASGSAFGRVKDVVPPSQTTYIHDHEPRHKETLKSIEKTIDKGYRVVLLPHSIKSKDINDMVLSKEIDPDTIEEFFASHSYKGLEAKLKFEQWRLYK